MLKTLSLCLLLVVFPTNKAIFISVKVSCLHKFKYFKHQLKIETFGNESAGINVLINLMKRNYKFVEVLGQLTNKNKEGVLAICLK